MWRDHKAIERPDITPSHPLAHAYAHRDCEFNPPLWRSLRHGFTHIEVDVYCLFGRIFVGHDLSQLRPGRTLQTLYLEPLRQLLRHKPGQIFTDDTPLWLFVDVKTEARSSWLLLRTLLESYHDIVTTFTPSSARTKSVTVVVSGNRPPYLVTEREPFRFAALDGRLPDAGVYTNPHVMPVVSDDWRKHFSWMGHGPMPDDERRRLKALIDITHRHSQRLRFWNTPDGDTPQRKCVWDQLTTLGIDLISTDDVEGLKNYLNQRG